MTCQHCGKNPAQVHSITNHNGQVSDLHLCLACAQELAGIHLNIGEFIAGVMGSAPTPAADPPEGTACPHCGFTRDQVAKRGKVGCSRCYAVFAEVIEPMLRRIHGRVRHVGKIPVRLDDAVHRRARQAEELKRQLDHAITSEDYERAAVLRDEIRALASAGDAG